MSIIAVVFDLGKVIFPFSHEVICERLSGYSPFNADEIYQLIFGSGLEKEFDRGKITPKKFYQRACRLIRAKISLDDFHRIWVNIFSQDQEVVRLVRELRSYKRYLLSNTNQWHYLHLQGKYPMLGEFDGYALSYEIGATKPEAAIFQKILTLSGLKARTCLYIDDIAEYAQAASRLGFIAIHFTGAKQLRHKLENLNLKLIK